MQRFTVEGCMLHRCRGALYKYAGCMRSEVLGVHEVWGVQGVGGTPGCRECRGCRLQKVRHFSTLKVIVDRIFTTAILICKNKC